MATKNIFEFLDSDNEQQQSQTKAPRQRQRKQNQEQLGQKVQNDLPERQRKEVDTRHKKPYHNKRGDGENRPARRQRSKDRHISGTGRDTQQRNFRKGGAGKGNVGTTKDEQQRLDEQEAEVPVESSEEEEEEVEDKTMTLDQYYEKQGIQQQQNKEAKQQQAKKIDEADLKKEKLTLVQSRNKVERNANQKQAQAYKPTYNGDLADQINFKTGLVPEKKPKKAKQPVAAEGAEQQAEKTEEKPRQQQRNNQRPAQQQRKPNQKRNQGFKGDNEDFPGL